MGQSVAKAAIVDEAESGLRWLDGGQRAALRVFADANLAGSNAEVLEKLQRVMPTSVAEPLVRAVGKGGHEGLAVVLNGLLEPKREFEAVLRLVSGGEGRGEAERLLAVVACAECFWAMLDPNEAGPCLPEEIEALKDDLQGEGGWEVGRLLLLRCCGTGEMHSGPSTVLGGRLARWRLARRVGEAGLPWTPLYSSERDGRGAAAFGRAMACYPAATVLVVRSEQGDVVGCYSETEWRSGGRFFGSSRGKVFTVQPRVQVFPSTGVSSNFCYFHVPSSKAQLVGTVPDGVGVGGQVGAFRLHVDADFRRGEASVYDSTFESGQLVPLAAALDPSNADVVQFDVAAVEVWGLGGAKAKEVKQAKEEHEMKEAMKRRQVNRRIALGGEDEDGNVDMWLVESAGAHVSYVKEANHNDAK